MPLAAIVDRSRCQGAQSCVRIAPGTFHADAEGKAFVVESTGDDDEAIRQAAERCPFFAIELAPPTRS